MSGACPSPSSGQVSSLAVALALSTGVSACGLMTLSARFGARGMPLPLVLVQDVASALVTALDTPGIEGQSFNLVAESEITARDYLDALEQCISVEFQKLPTPIWKFYLTDVTKWLVKRAIRHPDRRHPSYRDWESRTQRAFFDCSKARKILGWNPVSERDEMIRRGIEEPALELS